MQCSLNVNEWKSGVYRLHQHIVRRFGIETFPVSHLHLYWEPKYRLTTKKQNMEKNVNKHKVILAKRKHSNEN